MSDGTKKASLTWTGPGLRLVGTIAGGPAIVVDSPKEGLGTHSGPSPMELVLLGLGGCTGMDVFSILTKKRQPVTGYEVRLEGERADSHPKKYTKIQIEYVVYGKGVDAKAVERAIELSETKYCSVHAMLEESVEITTSYRIVEEQPTPHEPGDAPE